MLSSLVKEHQGRQAARKEQQEVNKLLAVCFFPIEIILMNYIEQKTALMTR